MENNMQIDKSVFDKICRTCLATTESYPIFALKHDDIPIVSLLDSCLSVHVENDDNLPQNLCFHCLQEIIRIHNFQEESRRNQSLLRFALTEVEVVKQEVDIDDEIIKQEEVLKSPKNKCNPDSGTNQRSENKPQENNKVTCFVSPNKACGLKDEQQNHNQKLEHEEVQNNAKLPTKINLRKHIQEHSEKKKYNYSTRAKRFDESGNSKRDVSLETKERPHICHLCGKAFTKSRYLKRHLNKSCKGTAADQPILVCSVCRQSFKRYANYCMHLRKHEVDKLNVQEKTLIEQDKREHICEICKRSYETKTLLTSHMNTHKEKKFCCSYCNKGFVARVALELHERIHTGMKPCVCNVCNKSFTHPSTLGKHKLIHTKGKRFMCHICNQSFRISTNLSSHLHTHTKDKPYKCPQCGRGFSQLSNMKRHQKRHI